MQLNAPDPNNWIWNILVAVYDYNNDNNEELRWQYIGNNTYKCVPGGTSSSYECHPKNLTRNWLGWTIIDHNNLGEPVFQCRVGGGHGICNTHGTITTLKWKWVNYIAGKHIYQCAPDGTLSVCTHSDAQHQGQRWTLSHHTSEGHPVFFCDVNQIPPGHDNWDIQPYGWCDNQSLGTETTLRWVKQGNTNKYKCQPTSTYNPEPNAGYCYYDGATAYGPLQWRHIHGNVYQCDPTGDGAVCNDPGGITTF